MSICVYLCTWAFYDVGKECLASTQMLLNTLMVDTLLLLTYYMLLEQVIFMLLVRKLIHQWLTLIHYWLLIHYWSIFATLLVSRYIIGY